MGTHPAGECNAVSRPCGHDRAQPDTSTVSVVIPCLNEEENIRACVTAALRGAGAQRARRRGDRRRQRLRGSQRQARRRGRRDRRPRAATGLRQRLPGWLGGGRGEFVVMADADLTYDFDDIPRFVERLQAGADLVMGDRMDNIQPGAMPWLHRYIGNPLLSGLLNVFFRTGVRDAHCGMRAIRRDDAAEPRSAHDGDGVRLRDGRPGQQGEAGDRRGADPLFAARRRRPSCRVSVTAGATCATYSSTARSICSSSPGWCSASSECWPRCSSSPACICSAGCGICTP